MWPLSRANERAHCHSGRCRLQNSVGARRASIGNEAHQTDSLPSQCQTQCIGNLHVHGVIPHLSPAPQPDVPRSSHRQLVDVESEAQLGGLACADRDVLCLGAQPRKPRFYNSATRSPSLAKAVGPRARGTLVRRCFVVWSMGVDRPRLTCGPPSREAGHGR